MIFEYPKSLGRYGFQYSAEEYEILFHHKEYTQSEAETLAKSFSIGMSEKYVYPPWKREQLIRNLLEGRDR